MQNNNTDGNKPDDNNNLQPSPPEVAPKAKSDGFFGRIDVKKREELGRVLKQDIPLQLPVGHHLLYPMSQVPGGGIVYLAPVSMPEEKREVTYLVFRDVVNEAYQRALAGDQTFVVL